MKIALCQMSMSDNIIENLDKSLKALEEASLNDADLIVYPEIQLTKFFPQYPGKPNDDYAVTMEDEIINKFKESCKKYEIMSAPNLFLFEENNYYDATFLINKEGEIIGKQKMVHIAQAEQFYEQDYYTPSEEGFLIFNTEHGKIGIVICFDRHYPESIRTQTIKGADLIIIPTANVKTEPLDIFQYEIQVQSYQNSVYIAMCNRVGNEDKMNFAGESIVTDPNGKVIKKADDKEQIIYVDIDIQEARNIRKSHHYTNLRRPELYK